MMVFAVDAESGKADCTLLLQPNVPFGMGAVG
jgi:hypothetical protein